LQLIGPECLVAIGVKSEYLSTLLDQLLRIVFSAAEKLGCLLAVICVCHRYSSKEYGGHNEE
jgi:hypothetical protein